MSVEQRNNPKLLMGIMGALVTVVVLVLLYQWLNAPSKETQRMQQEEIAAVPATTSTATTEEDTDASNAAEALETKALISGSLLKAPVPENSTLANEEMAKLADIQVQLNEQKATLDAQHSDADQLIQLKEEQIKLLEAQLAQGQ